MRSPANCDVSCSLEHNREAWFRNKRSAKCVTKARRHDWEDLIVYAYQIIASMNTCRQRVKFRQNWNRTVPSERQSTDNQENLAMEKV